MPKAITAQLILIGLPSSYNNYTSRKYKELTEDLAAINISKLITNLILKEERFNFNINLEANKAFKNNQSYYKYYNKKGHIKDKCFIKYPKLKNYNSLNLNNKSKNNKIYKKDFKKSKVIFKKK